MLMLAGVVHGVDLGHAAGQVAQQPRPDLGVDAFTGGQEAGDFIHALAESCAIFSQDGGVGVQSSCSEEGETCMLSRLVLRSKVCFCNSVAQEHLKRSLPVI